MIEREIQFNNDWKFRRADFTRTEQNNFDDSDWRVLDLPEKEGVKQIGPFSEESAGRWKRIS